MTVLTDLTFLNNKYETWTVPEPYIPYPITTHLLGNNFCTLLGLNPLADRFIVLSGGLVHTIDRLGGTFAREAELDGYRTLRTSSISPEGKRRSTGVLQGLRNLASTATEMATSLSPQVVGQTSALTVGSYRSYSPDRPFYGALTIPPMDPQADDAVTATLICSLQDLTAATRRNYQIHYDCKINPRDYPEYTQPYLRDSTLHWNLAEDLRVTLATFMITTPQSARIFDYVAQTEEIIPAFPQQLSALALSKFGIRLWFAELHFRKILVLN